MVLMVTIVTAGIKCRTHGTIAFFAWVMCPLSLSTAAEVLCVEEKRCNYINVKMFLEAEVSEKARAQEGAEKRTHRMINYPPSCKVINLA